VERERRHEEGGDGGGEDVVFHEEWIWNECVGLRPKQGFQRRAAVPRRSVNINSRAVV
jgi:hypothetical protein